MKMQPWIPVLAGVVLLFGAIDRAWCQPKCTPGAIYRCTRPTVVEKPGGCAVIRVCVGRPACDGCNECRPKVCGKTESACATGIAQKGSTYVPRKVVTAAEPRKLALPRGSCKRIVPAESPKSGQACCSAKTGVCPIDCRHETIFGTETIFGDFSLREHAACPYACDKGGGGKPLPGVFSQMDASLQKIFVCRRSNCGKSSGKGCSECADKSKCADDMRESPILEGQPHERRREENPFRDEAIESAPDAPAPLPPAPLLPAVSEASRVRLDEPTTKLGVVRVQPAPGNSSLSLRQVDSEAVGSLPKPRTTSDRPLSMRRPSVLFSSIRLE